MSTGHRVSARPGVSAEHRPRQVSSSRAFKGNEFIPIAALGIVLLVLIAAGGEELPVGGTGLVAALAVLRVPLGLAYVLFVPGYTLQAALHPRASDLAGAERLALSFGLSVAVVPPMALILDRLPWGIRLWPIVVAEGLFIAVCSVLAWTRRRPLPREERFALDLRVDVGGWWRAQDRTNRILYGAFAGAVLVALIAALTIVVLPRPGEQFTEFYILGPEGWAEDYPRQAAGEPVEVEVGIANREGVATAYRVEVTNGRNLIGQSDWVRLAPGEVDERAVTFVPYAVGEDVPVDFLLYREGEAEPYRSLRLWLAAAGGSEVNQ